MKPLEEQDSHFKGPNNEEEMSEKTQNNIVTSLAEKALLVAAPMVPTKEGGGGDHERSDIFFSCKPESANEITIFCTPKVPDSFPCLAGLLQC